LISIGKRKSARHRRNHLSAGYFRGKKEKRKKGGGEGKGRGADRSAMVLEGERGHAAVEKWTAQRCPEKEKRSKGSQLLSRKGRGK